MTAHKEMDAVPRESLANEEKTNRVANGFSLQALDHMLAIGVGVARNSFVVDKVVGKLEKGERRYMVPASTIPGARQRPGDPPDKQRSCIATAEGHRRLELPVEEDAKGQLFRPSLHLCTYERPMGPLG